MKDILKAVVFGGLFLIPFLTLLVNDSLFFPYITGKNFAFRILIEILFTSWIVLALLDARYRPKFSYIMASFSVFMGVMLLATLFAHHVPTAFWSNYERMDGYVGLLHVFGYFVVLSSVLIDKKHWEWFLQVTVVVASMVAIHGLSQLASPDSTGGRVDGTLGNAAYMAIYMLFHLFFLAYLFVQTKNPLLRIVYCILSVLFLFVLVQTGTRGTALGFIVGVITAIGYISMFGQKEPVLRKYAIGAVLVLVVCASGFMALRDTEFVQGNSNLARIANIDLKEDLAIRGIIWSMAMEGVNEKPLLGWGMGNYNYVFNEQYDPRLYDQEQWFDRVHNIALDWLVAGGVVGFLAYVSIFVSLLYYLFIRPYFYRDETFSTAESAILVGLVAGYITHNLVVFDNIVSYIFFATIIAYIHSRVARPVVSIQSIKVAPALVIQIIMPVLIVSLVAVVYVLNVPSIYSAQGIISALRTNNMEERYEIFDRTLTRGSFAQQEIVEQFVQQAISVARTADVAEEIKELYLTRADQEIQNQIKHKPGDARLHVFAASFYRSTGQIEKALAELAIAHELSPGKQWIILQQGAATLTLGQNEEARDFFKKAFELDERFVDAREYYVASLFLTGATTSAQVIIDEADEDFIDRLALSDFTINAINTSGDKDFAITLFERRAELKSNVPQTWASLAFLYYQNKENEKAIDALSRGAAKNPAFKKTADCISGNITAGRAPETPCN